HRPLIEPSSAQALFGLVTPMAEAAVLLGAAEHLFSGDRSNGAGEVRALPFFLLEMAQYFVPGVGLDRAAESGRLFTFKAWVLVSAVACALLSFWLTRRHAFSRARCMAWSLCGFLFAWAGLALMLVLQDWPSRVACPSCRQLRRVDRERCEHCGAAHAPPAPDGTEVFEPTAAIPHPAVVER